MAYLFFIDGVPLPVTPSALNTKIKNKNESLNLLNEGEATLIKSPGLTEISFDVMLPHVKYPFAYYPNGFKNASYYLKKLENLKVKKKPFQFICTRRNQRSSIIFNTNIKVTLEDYTIKESAGDGQCLMVSISLKQYVPYGTKTLKVVTRANKKVTLSTSNSATSRVSKTISNTYTVVAGDSLWSIAKKQLGDGSRYTEIYNLNTDKISNPALIYPNQVFVLPS